MRDRNDRRVRQQQAAAVRRGGPELCGRLARQASRSGGAQSGANIYQRIGVRPIINCKGTFTIISGSQSLPEVKKALEEASRHYVHLDELMDGVGRRLAELTQGGMGNHHGGMRRGGDSRHGGLHRRAQIRKRCSGCRSSAGLKNEVVMPGQSRNVYDHAIRMTGVTMVTPTTREEFLAALGPRTAMVAMLGEDLATASHDAQGDDRSRA